MLACPLCDSTEISRMPSAPHIAKSSSIKTEPSTALSNGGVDLSSLNGDVVALTGRDHSELEAKVQAAFRWLNIGIHLD